MTSIYRFAGKRLLDVVLVLIGAPVFVLVSTIVSIVVLISIGRPVLFSQRRPGLNARLFTLRKFRTMTQATDSSGVLLPDDVRLTAAGRWLRAASLDELPELWNVLIGDMSLVGPRPLLPRYLDRYSTRQAMRHLVRPGVTGLAQVNGRNAASWEQKFEYDVQYVEQYSLSMDMRILAKTALVVLRRDGVNQAGHATMEEFRGKQ